MLAVQMITFILERGENDYLGKTHVASEEFKKVIDKSGIHLRCLSYFY